MSVNPLASPATSTPWVPLWPVAPVSLGELAYAERTTPLSPVTATPQVLITAPSITLDGATPIIVEFTVIAFAPPNVALQTIDFSLYDNGVSVRTIASAGASSTSQASTTMTGRVRITPTAGAHVLDVRVTATNTGGPPAVFAGAAYPVSLRVSLAAPISNAPAGALLPVQYGTSLPVSPIDGQEAILVDSTTAPKYQWRFRWNAGSSSAYKWECVGGSPWVTVVDAAVAISGSWGVQTPTVTIPRSGDWLVSHHAQVTGAVGCYLGIVLNGTLQDPGIGRTAGTNEAGIGRANMPFTVAAGNYFNVASWGSGTMLYRSLAIQPVRVS